MSYRAGFVGLIGLPNAGKSSCLNQFVESQVSIVTAKPQTTRRRILGIVSKDEGQIVFVDAPGVLRNQKGLNRFLEEEALGVIQDSDVLVAVIALDTEKKEAAEHILKMCSDSRKPFVVLVTKMDLVQYFSRKEKIEEMAKSFKGYHGIFDFSTAWKGEGKEALFKQLLHLLPTAQKPLYDEELFTPHTVRELAVEAIREKCFLVLDKELPYQVAVWLRKFDESKGRKPEIHADIIVAKDSHKPIVVGKGGLMIKKIGQLARKDIEEMVGSDVVLKLEVVVKENWAENKNLMKDLGYVVIKS